MKLVHTALNQGLKIEYGQPCEWIIEAPEFFTNVVQGMYNQKNGLEGEFTLSLQDKILSIPKKMEIILNPLTIDINDKRILNKLYEQLSEMANSEVFYMKTQDILKEIYEYIFQLEQEYRYVLNIEEGIDLNTLFKAAGVRYEVYREDFLETLCRYMKIISDLLGIKLIVCINLRSYLTDEQMTMLVEDIKYEEFGVLFIENQERTCLSGMNRYIMDRDLCEI